MYEFYKIETDEDVLSVSRKYLRSLYKMVPETDGCIDNTAKVGGCESWCCRYQSPQLMYCEFLNIWHHILKNSSPEKVAQLVIKAIRSYLNNSPTKGCMMWSKVMQCTVHKNRPLNCRMYGQIPEEEFKPRYERLKVLYENKIGAVVRDQCHLVETDGPEVTKDMTDRWQKDLEKIERLIGIPVNQIHDRDNGSYRQFHDHILLRMCDDKLLAELTNLKLKGTNEQKEAFIKNIVSKVKKTHPTLVDTRDEDAPSPIIIAR